MKCCGTISPGVILLVLFLKLSSPVSGLAGGGRVFLQRGGVVMELFLVGGSSLDVVLTACNRPVVYRCGTSSPPRCRFALLPDMNIPAFVFFRHQCSSILLQ